MSTPRIVYKFLSQPQALKLIMPQFRRYWLRISCGLIALIGVDIFQLLIPRIVKSAVDGLSSGIFSDAELKNHALLILLLAIGVALCRFLWRYLVLGFSRLLEQNIRDSLFSHLLILDRAFFQKRTTGELMALATNDLSSVQLASGMGLISFVDAMVMGLAVLGFMAYINPLLTLIAICPLPILAVLTKLLSARLHERFTKVQEQFSTLTEMARSTISSMRLIKVYTREKDQISQFDLLGRQYISHSLKVAKIQGTLFPVSGLIANTSLLLVLVMGGRMVINQVITIGDFIAFISYLFMMTWPMMAIGWVTNLFQRGLTSLARIQNVLEERPLLCGPQNSCHSIRTFAEPSILQIQGLTFTYPGHKVQVLKEINLTIKNGMFGIIGQTGSGKSSLCHLLARLYPVADGDLYLNGTDINNIPLLEYRRHIAYVPQEPVLFSSTIAANISYGCPQASDAEIIKVAETVGIHREISEFPAGYQTRIGEKGIKLSGGQRQRLCLARALMTAPPILIIDDGLSAVDADTEQHILNSLEDYAVNKTVIMVAHRLSTLAAAETIAVLERGAICGLGTHRQLLSENNYYRNIYRNQSEKPSDSYGKVNAA